MRISVDPTDRRIHTVAPHYVFDCVSAGKRLDIRKWKKKQLFRGLYARFGGDAVEFEDLWIARGGIIGDGGYAFLSGVILQQPPTDRDLDVRYITDCIADRCLLPTDDYVYRTIRLFSGMSVWWHSNNAVARVAFSALGGRALVDDEIREEMLGAYQCIVLDGEETPQIASARAAGATVVPSTWVSDCIRNGSVLSKGLPKRQTPSVVVESPVAPRERKRRQWEPLYSDDDDDDDDNRGPVDVGNNDIELASLSGGDENDDNDPKGTYANVPVPEGYILERRLRAYRHNGLLSRDGKLYCRACKEYINAMRADTCKIHVTSKKHRINVQ